jgi:intein/homing endonuclease
MLTATEIYKEYANCLVDPIYVVETYFKTFDKTRNGYVPFKLFRKQKEIVKALKDHRFNIVAKPRQAGVSTTVAATISVLLGFADENNPEAILIVANKQDMAFEFLAKIKYFLDQIPRWAWGPDYYGTPEKEKKSIFSSDSKKEIRLPNGCRVKAVATSPDALRGYTPTFLIMDEAAFIDDGKDLFGAALTALGCLTKDSLILTENGLVQLDELVIEKDKIGFTDLVTPHKVCNMNGEIVDATQTFVSEYGETYKIKTKIGLELEGSWKHPLYVDNGGDNNWVRMNELQIGDKVVINYNQNYFGSDKFIFDYELKSIEKNLNIPEDFNTNLDFAYLLGLFVAEGNFNSGGITITNIDKEITNFLINDGANLGRGFTKINEKHYQLSSTKLVRWMAAFGLKKHNAKDKEIPLPILKMSKPVIVSFLRGLFDGDGCSTNKEIKYSSTSHKLIKTLQILLLNFGIKSHIRYEEQKTSESSVVSNKNHITKIYNLCIYSDYALKFYDEIGFKLIRKQENRKYLIDRLNNSRHVYIDKEKVSRLLKDNHIPKSKVRFMSRFWDSKYNRLTYNAIFKLKALILSHPVLDELLYGVEQNKFYFTDEIVSIEKSEGYTYDLHVPKTNSFISNGLISHNTGGRSVLISTPNGLDELYYETYDSALKKKNDFNIIEMRWYQDDRYNIGLKWYKYTDKEKKDLVVIEEEDFTFESFDKKIKDSYKPTSPWYEEMCRGMNNDPRMIAQELDVSFLGSGGNVISDEYVEYHKNKNVKDPVFVSGRESELWVWEEPIEGHEYILSSDVSRGDGEDYSTFTIIDFTTMTQVVEYMGRIPPDKLADMLFEYGKLYNALVVVDITGGMGVATILKLQDMKYPNLYYGEKGGQALKKRKDLHKYNSDNEIAGFQVGSDRTRLVSTFEKMVRINKDEGDSHGIKIRSARLISELYSFVYINGRADHAKNKHDDLIMAMAMALFVLENSFKQLKANETRTKAMLASWVSFSAGGDTRSTVSPTKQEPKKPNFSPIVAKNMQDPRGEYMWLFGGYQ